MQKIVLNNDSIVESKKHKAGDVVAVVDCGCDLYTLASLIRSRQVSFVPCDHAEAIGGEELTTEPSGDEPSDPPTEDSPGDDPTPGNEEPIETVSEVAGARLFEAGLPEKLVERLVDNKLTTPESVRQYVEGGGDLVDLDRIGEGYAAKIQEILGL